MLNTAPNRPDSLPPEQLLCAQAAGVDRLPGLAQSPRAGPPLACHCPGAIQPPGQPLAHAGAPATTGPRRSPPPASAAARHAAHTTLDNSDHNLTAAIY